MPIIADILHYSELCKDKALLGLDIGTKTIGTAICDPNWQLATPLSLIKRAKFMMDRLALEELIAIHKIGGMVIGLPLTMEGIMDKRAQSSQSFAMNLSRHEHTNLPIFMWDERLSTKAVERILIKDLDQSRAKRALNIDRHAACFILQGALDRLHHL